MNRIPQETVLRAGRAIKILQLAKLPGMDHIAVKLNSELTWNEEHEALWWAKAFELADTEMDVWALADMLRKEMR